MGSAEFQARWNALVVEWDRARAREPDAAEALLREVLRDGLEARPAPDSSALPDDATALACAVEVVELSGRFDADGYLAANDDPPLRSGAITPAAHFCTYGWQLLRNPRGDFDLWWYWTQHLDPRSTAVNPFVHHLLAGAHAGLPARAEPLPVRPDPPVTDPTDVRRVCLFASHDLDGRVDDTVVHYVTELSRHADVYFLTSSLTPAAQLARLSGSTRGAWAVPHGGHDMGSYALLARELVGWDTIDGYDELLLVNDSTYLLRPLDDLMASMDDTPADWWGLHAAPRRPAAGPLAPSGPGPQDWGPRDHPRIGSHFVVLRKRVMDDPGFRDHLETVTQQPRRELADVKYEVGLTDALRARGFAYATPSGTTHHADPLYTEAFFALLAQGFPLMKRNLVAKNPFQVADLASWKQRVLDHVPDAPVDTIELDLVRSAPDDALQQSLAITTGPDGSVDRHAPMTALEFRRADFVTPTFDHWWAFPVCAYDHTFAGNERAVFEEVREDPSIKKIVLTRSRRVDVEGADVVVVPLNSPEGQYHLLRSGQVFVKHGPMSNVPWPLSPTLHNFINLWHGIPLKRFNLASVGLTERARAAALRSHGASRAVITSSKIDTLAMTAAFHPVPMAEMWPTGLPRNDVITCPEDRLPADLRASLERLRTEADGRRVVMFLPTFKDGQADAYYDFGADGVTRLGEWLARNNAVLAVREHMADRAHTYSRMLAPLDPINLSSRRFPDLEVLYRAADVLVSDYSSCLVDFLLTGRPVISFAYDYDNYAHQERGLFYDLPSVLPGPLTRTFDELLTALDDSLRDLDADEREVYEWKRRVFFDHLDAGASRRVVARVKALYR